MTNVNNTLFNAHPFIIGLKFKSLRVYTLKIEHKQSGGTCIDFIQ